MRGRSSLNLSSSISWLEENDRATHETYRSGKRETIFDFSKLTIGELKTKFKSCSNPIPKAALKKEILRRGKETAHDN